jgi:hypothetical protein
LHPTQSDRLTTDRFTESNQLPSSESYNITLLNHWPIWSIVVVQTLRFSAPFSGSQTGQLVPEDFLSRYRSFETMSKVSLRHTIFAVAVVSGISAKVCRLLAHRHAIDTTELLVWGASCFTQENILFLALRVLIDKGPISLSVVVVVSSMIFLLASISIAFYLMTGTEPQWRNATSAADLAAWKMLSTSLASVVIVMTSLAFAAMASRRIWFAGFGAGVDVVRWSLERLTRGTRRVMRASVSRSFLYRHEPYEDEAGTSSCMRIEGDSKDQVTEDHAPIYSKLSCLHICVGAGFMYQILSTLFRPSTVAMRSMSWALLLLPFAGFFPSSEISVSTTFLEMSADRETSDSFTWLPNKPMAGFEGWRGNSTRYALDTDPLKVSNFGDELLSELKDSKLMDLNIRHIVLLTLESTRQDVFPLVERGAVRQRLSTTFDNQEIPEEIQTRLDSLTPFASWLVNGDDPDAGSPASFANLTSRGSVHARDAFTTSTYTIKSLIGTHCGLSPVTADFNVEYLHRAYQPCLPQVLDMLNNVQCPSSPEAVDEARTGNWTSVFMQSTTLGFDKQDELMPTLGFPKERIIGAEYLREAHEFDPATLADVNYFGMPEEAVQAYLRDAFTQAKRDNERVFLSHLTSTTHHAFGIPESTEYAALSGDTEWESLSRYLNAVGYVDRWLQKIFTILEEESVANETLVVVVGDHGLAIAEQGSYTPYGNAHVATMRVPLVMSMPGLPNIEISSPVSTLQVVPSILDLLLETESLSPCAAEAARDIRNNYEGQSLIRPLRLANETSGQGDWIFTVMNPGGLAVAVRDARQPSWRLVVPLVDGEEWWFSDLEQDPYDMSPVRSMDRAGLARKLEVQGKHTAVEWSEEAIDVAYWWVEKNHQRWGYET